MFLVLFSESLHVDLELDCLLINIRLELCFNDG